MCCGKCYYWIWNGGPLRVGYCSFSKWEYRKELQPACKSFVADDGSNTLKSPDRYRTQPRQLTIDF